MNFNVQLLWKVKKHLVCYFISQLQYRSENQNFISNLVFQFIKKMKWHFRCTDSHLQFNMRHPKEFSFLLKSWLVETKSGQKNELNKLNYCYIGIYINCINISGKHFRNKYVTFKEKDRKHIFVNSSSEDCVHRLFYVYCMVRTMPDSQILSYKLYSTN